MKFTRFRPYRKKDQARVERKNGAVLRHTLGHRRYDWLEAVAAMAKLCRSVRLFMDFIQPSFKSARKSRDGAKVTKRYQPPATPHRRLIGAAGEFDWSILRPDVIIGNVAGNAMNMAMVIGVFASLCKATRTPLRFPGSTKVYDGVFAQLTDAHLLAGPRGYSIELGVSGGLPRPAVVPPR